MLSFTTYGASIIRFKSYQEKMHVVINFNALVMQKAAWRLALKSLQWYTFSSL